MRIRIIGRGLFKAASKEKTKEKEVLLERHLEEVEAGLAPRSSYTNMCGTVGGIDCSWLRSIPMAYRRRGAWNAFRVD